jgi:hypothetical protein
MTELSPSAKIILAASAKANCLQEWDHVNDPPCHPDDSDWNGCYTCIHRAGIAAALRAAADHLTPYSVDQMSGAAFARHRLQIIARELENYHA